jgi:hypothetical protein
MTEYRAFLVGPDGHFKDVRTFDCAHDEEATETALHLVDGCAVELWSGDRFVPKITDKKVTEKSQEAKDQKDRT